jgi:hypothetical protein
LAASATFGWWVTTFTGTDTVTTTAGMRTGVPFSPFCHASIDGGVIWGATLNDSILVTHASRAFCLVKDSEHLVDSAIVINTLTFGFIVT